MAMRELVFDIFAVDRASRTLSKVGTEADVMGSKLGTAGKVASEGLMVASAVAVGLGVKAVEMAGNFESAITRLQTTAGESTANLKMVGDGLLAMAGKVGYSAQDLAVGMYTVESAGYHGAAGLKVMEAAAKGARVEGADLTTVTDAVSSLLVDYHLKASQAAMVTNTLTAAVGHGKTTFEGMAAALPNVAAAGASAHLSMAELSSAIATMTMHGTDAAKAGTYLRQVIGQLEAPSAKASGVMKSLGIDSNKLALTLSSGSGHGLADAIQMIDSAITNHLQPSGLVALQTFRKSSGSVQDYHKMLSKLPPTYTTSFGALTKMVGGVKSLQGFLQLGGENLKTYRKNVAAVNEQVRKGGHDVEGYAAQQKTLNGKIDDIKGAFSALMVQLGQKLMPVAKSLADEFLKFTGYLTQHQSAVMAVGAAILGLTTALLLAKGITMAWGVAVNLAKGAQIVWIAATEGMTAAQEELNIAMDANPIGAVIVAITALVAGVIYAYTHFQTFHNIVNAVFSWLKTAVVAVINFVKGHWKLIIAIMLGPFGIILGQIISHWHAISSAVSAGVNAVINFVRGHWKLLVGIILGPFGAIVALVATHWSQITGLFRQAWSAIKSVVTAGISAVVGFMRSLPGKLKAALGNLSGLLVQAGKDLIQGLINGVKSMVGSAMSAVANVGHSITGAIKGALQIHSPSRVFHGIGVNVGEGLRQGIDSTRPALKAEMDKVGSDLKAKGNELKSVLQNMSTYSSSLTSKFETVDPSQGGLADFLKGLRQDRSNARHFKDDLEQAKGNGLSGPLLKFLAASGNDVLLSQIANSSPAQMRQYEALYASRNKAASGVGHEAALSVYGKKADELRAEIKGLREDVRHLAKATGHEVASALNNTAATARRRRNGS